MNTSKKRTPRFAFFQVCDKHDVMTKYNFFSAQLRFVANRTVCESGDVKSKIDQLLAIADAVEGGNENFFIAAENLKIASRALAGVAGFLHQHILPEVIADANTAGEKQVRWTIDACMEMMAQLMTHAELSPDAKGLFITLPPLN